MAGLLEHEFDYNIQVLNLIDLSASDGFNPLAYIEDEVDVEIVAKTIINNTSLEEVSHSKSDPFWEFCEISIFKAVIMYFKNHTDEEATLPLIYDFINNLSVEEIHACFMSLPRDSTAVKYYNTFNKAEKLKGNILLGLCARLSLIANNDIATMLSKNDIDIYGLKARPTAIFIIIPDQHNALSFISAVFFSTFGQKLSKYTDKYKNDLVIGQREVFALIDETYNIGRIPNFDNWISTFRARKIILVISFQDINQMKELYGDNMWESIFSNCSTKIILRVSDKTTSEFISDYIGYTSIKVMTKFKEAGVFKMMDNKHISHTDRERKLINADELRGLKKEQQVVLTSGCKPMLTYKVPWIWYEDLFELAQKHYRSPNKYIPKWKRSKDFTFTEDGKAMTRYNDSGRQVFIISSSSMTEKKEHENDGESDVQVTTYDQLVDGEDSVI